MISFSTLPFKKIFFISLVISCFGLLAESMVFVHVSLSIQLLLTIQNLLQVLSVSLFRISWFEYYNSDNSLSLNFIQLTAYLFLLAGALIYYFSQGKEVRLLRVIMAIVLLSSSTALVMAGPSAWMFSSYISAAPYGWSLMLFTILKHIALVYFSYRILISIHQSKEMDNGYIERNERQVYASHTASKGDRFFHLILDLLLSLILFWPLAVQIAGPLLQSIEENLGRRTSLFVYSLVARFLYYLFFELLLQATPGKLFTESRVLTFEGNKPSAKTIINRTLARFIPFEAFSFFAPTGWHDDLSNTQVVKEKQTGVATGRYWFIPALMAGLVAIGFLLHTLYEDYRIKKYMTDDYNKKNSAIQYELNHLSTSTLLELNERGNYDGIKTYLKIEKITPEEITASFITQNNTYSESILAVERLYEKDKTIWPQITIKRSALNTSYAQDYESSLTDKKPCLNLFEYGNCFDIKRIVRLYEPHIESRSTGGSNGNSFSLDMVNYGWPAKITKFTTLEGDMKWQNEMPLEAPSVGENDYPRFHISWEGTRGEDYKFQFETVDTLGRTGLYEVEGRNWESTAKKIR